MTIILTVVLAMASVMLAYARLDMQTDELELISQDHPLIATSDKFKPFKGIQTFIVVIEAPQPERAISFLEALVPQVQEDHGRFGEIFYRVPPDLLGHWAFLYLGERELRDLSDGMKQHQRTIGAIVRRPNLVNLFQAVNREMGSQLADRLADSLSTASTPGMEGEGRKSLLGLMILGVAECPELFQYMNAQDGRIGAMLVKSMFGKSREKVSTAAIRGDAPLDLDLNFLIDRLEGISRCLDGLCDYNPLRRALLSGTASTLEQEGYFWAGDRRFLLCSVEPKASDDVLNGSRASLERLRELVRATKAAFPDVRAGVTGQEALNADEMTVAFKDMLGTTWIAFLGVFFLVVLFFRSLRWSLMQMVSLGIGLSWTFGWTTVFIGHLNILSVVFAPLLIGLGVDYGIHLFARLEEEESTASADLRETVERVAFTLGPGVLYAGLSAAFSFFPLALTGFRGLMELGLITGMGLLFVIVADFTVLPALIIVFQGRRPRRCAILEPRGGSTHLNWSRGSRFVVSGAILACAFCVWHSRKVGFDLNPLDMHSKGVESVVWLRNLAEGSGQSVIHAVSLASSMEELRERTDRLKEFPTVDEVRSALTLLPQDQETKRKLLGSLHGCLADIAWGLNRESSVDPVLLSKELKVLAMVMQPEFANRLGARSGLVEQMKRAGELSDSIVARLDAYPQAAVRLSVYQDRFQEDLRSLIDRLREASHAPPMTPEDLPAVVKNHFVNGGQYLIEIYPHKSGWQETSIGRFINDLRSVDSQVAGDPVVLHDFTLAFRIACGKAAVYGLALVFLLLATVYRGLVSPLLALMPLVVGSVWTVGLMGVVGINFNLANSMFLPLILGAGVEYAVIVLHRWREGAIEPGRFCNSTVKGVVLAALTTTIGFGSLMCSDHRGISSLGFVSCVGSLCALLSSILVLPAVAAMLPVDWVTGRSGQAQPGDRER